MKVRATSDKFLNVLQYCDAREVGLEIERCRKLAESGNLKGAAIDVLDQLLELNVPLPPAYWKVLEACSERPMDEWESHESS